MNIGKIQIFPFIASIICLLPCYAYASFIPVATTLSNQALTASIEGSTLLYGEVTVLTNTVAIALSTHPGQLNYPTIHSAKASALALNPIDSNTIATFISSQYTSAQAFSSTPLFAKSAAVSQMMLNAIISPTVATNLNLNWIFNDLSLKAEPTSSFAYISDVIQVFQQTVSGIKESVAGFFTFLENGKQSIGFFGDHTVTQVIQNWFSENTEQTANQVNLIENPSALTVNIYLPTNDNPFWLGIANTHTEYSAEAPPVATNQVADKIGYSASDNGSQMHWDADAGLLHFDRLPINTISNFFNQANSLEPLLSGYLEIDPLQFITQADNRDYYAGKKVRLVDEYGNVLYEASLPSIVFDDSLFAKQGFNFFAPILNVLSADPSASDWLNNYLSKSQINSLLLPELFIGFNPIINDNDIWSGSFSAPVSAFLSFTGVAQVSEPSSLWLVFLGLLIFRPSKRDYL